MHTTDSIIELKHKINDILAAHDLKVGIISARGKGFKMYYVDYHSGLIGKDIVEENTAKELLIGMQGYYQGITTDF